jgi:glycosyltransferase involved in cell wall biosynthesis
MKILMVTERYLPIWGGAENQLKQLIPRLAERGCEVSVVTRRFHADWPEKEHLDGVQVIRLGVPGTGTFQTLLFTSSLVIYILRNRQMIDILHSHGAVNMGALCSWLGRLLGMKNVAKIASAGRIPTFSDSWLRRLILKGFQCSSAIISMTEEIDAELATESTHPATIQRITNGVDASRFCKSERGIRDTWRREHGLAADAQVVLFSSRLVFGKGLDILLQAWGKVATRHRQAHLFILGDGADQRDSIEIEMKAKVQAESLERITFQGAVKDPEKYLGAADVFVFPSRQEGFPNALMEALSAGVAVVASDIGGVRPLIDTHRTGVLFVSEDSDDLAAKLMALLDDAPTIERLGTEARKEMIEKYSFEKIADEYVRLYGQVISGVAANFRLHEQQG